MGGVWYYPAMERIDMILWFSKITFVAYLSVMFLAFLKWAEIAQWGWWTVLPAPVGVAAYWLVSKIMPVVMNWLTAINQNKRRKFFVFWFGSVFGLFVAWWISFVFELSGITRSLVGICTWAWATTFWYVMLEVLCFCKMSQHAREQAVAVRQARDQADDVCGRG